MNDFKTMQDTHMAMLARQDANPDDPDLTRDAQAFINEAVVGSTFLSDPGERDLLRAYLRYWAGVIYQQTGAYPKTELRPAESSVGTAAPPELVTGPPPAARGGLPRWVLLAAAGLGLLLVAVVFLQGLNVLEQVEPTVPPVLTDEPGPGDNATGTPPPTRTLTPEPAVPPTTIDSRNAVRVARLAEVTAHPGGALTVAFNPAGAEVATGGADGLARFWRLPSLAPSRELVDQEGWVRAIAFSPDARASKTPPLFLAGGNDRMLRVYDRESLQPFARFLPSAENSGFVFAAQFNPDGRLIASGHGDGVARVWDVSSGTELTAAPQNTRLAQVQGLGTAVTDVAFRSDGANLALALAGSDNGLVVLDGSYTNVICSVPSGPATAVAYAPDSDILAGGTERGALVRERRHDEPGRAARRAP